MTTDPHRATAVLPLGGLNYGYKGAGLARVVDPLCSAFAGTAPGFLAPPFGGPDFATPTRLGHFFIILRPELFQPLDQINERLSAMLRDLRGQPAQPDARGMAPGDPEKAEMRERATNGIPVDTATWQALQEAAEHHQLKAPTPLGG